MLPALMILGALWLYPVIGLLVAWLTRKNLQLRNKIIKIFLIIMACTLLGVFTNISTTITVLDWLLLTNIYFTISFLLWLTTSIRKPIWRIPAMTLAGLVFSLCYLASTIGALGIAMASARFETSNEKWLGGGIIYKEQILGNALTNYRGKRVEIYRTIPWLPLIEWRIQSKEYYSVVAYLQPLTTIYNPGEKKLYLSASQKWGSKQADFKDTLLIR